eukprot:6343826-Amphidinium_carterae.1
MGRSATMHESGHRSNARDRLLHVRHGDVFVQVSEVSALEQRTRQIWAQEATPGFVCAARARLHGSNHRDENCEARSVYACCSRRDDQCETRQD